MKDLNKKVEQALRGEKNALEFVVEEVKDLVYNLSLKMLLFPEDAQDATQEILVRMITHLNTFQGKSSFETWVYRIATNYLITEQSRKTYQAKRISFDEYAHQIDKGQSDKIMYARSEEHTSELQSPVPISYAVFCLKKKKKTKANMASLIVELLYSSMSTAHTLYLSNT